jgi:hypothetical protein
LEHPVHNTGIKIEDAPPAYFAAIIAKEAESIFWLRYALPHLGNRFANKNEDRKPAHWRFDATIFI